MHIYLETYGSTNKWFSLKYWFWGSRTHTLFILLTHLNIYRAMKLKFGMGMQIKPYRGDVRRYFDKMYFLGPMKEHLSLTHWSWYLDNHKILYSHMLYAIFWKQKEPKCKKINLLQYLWFNNRQNISQASRKE